MNILNRKYVVEIFGRTYTTNVFVLVFVYCFHAYKDALSTQKGSQKSNFRILGSYVSVS